MKSNILAALSSIGVRGCDHLNPKNNKHDLYTMQCARVFLLITIHHPPKDWLKKASYC